MIRSSLRIFVPLAIFAAAAASRAAGPVGVTYTVTGSAGAYELDFTLSNNTGDNDLNLYFFGVSTPSLSASPSPFFDLGGPWNPLTNDGAGPNMTYQSVWSTGGGQTMGVLNGGSLSGFKVFSTELTAPTSVDWFAYGYDGVTGYTGAYDFATHNGPRINPGFMGTTQAVPEPATIAALGLGALGLLRRKRKA